MLFDAQAVLAEILKSQPPVATLATPATTPPKSAPLSQVSRVSQPTVVEIRKATAPNPSAQGRILAALSGGGEAVAGFEHPCTICNAANAPHGYGWPGQRRLIPANKRGRIWACDDCKPTAEAWWRELTQPLGPIYTTGEGQP